VGPRRMDVASTPPSLSAGVLARAKGLKRPMTAPGASHVPRAAYNSRGRLQDRQHALHLRFGNLCLRSTCRGCSERALARPRAVCWAAWPSACPTGDFQTVLCLQHAATGCPASLLWRQRLILRAGTRARPGCSWHDRGKRDGWQEALSSASAARPLREVLGAVMDE
jgi:hypothetical protein